MSNKIKTIKGLLFSGSKARVLKYFYEALDNFSEDDVFVDLFGGSLVLSAAIKAKFPNATVICNDYDNQILRYKNIERTQEIIDTIKGMVSVKYGDKIPDNERVNIQNYLKSLTDEYIDWVTLASKLLFSGIPRTKESLLNSEVYYHRICNAPLNKLNLEGVTIESADYREILKKYPNAVYIADPPYISTKCTDYKNTDYWNAADGLRIPYLLGDRFIYYEGERSEIVTLCAEVEALTGKISPFNDTCYVDYECIVGNGVKRKEFIIFKNISEKVA